MLQSINASYNYMKPSLLLASFKIPPYKPLFCSLKWPSCTDKRGNAKKKSLTTDDGLVVAWHTSQRILPSSFHIARNKSLDGGLGVKLTSASFAVRLVKGVLQMEYLRFHTLAHTLFSPDLQFALHLQYRQEGYPAPL